MATTKAALAAENAALRKQVADLKLDIEMLRKQGIAAQQSTPSRRVQQATPAWHQARAAEMAAVRADEMATARDIAMRTGRVVKV